MEKEVAAAIAFFLLSHLLFRSPFPTIAMIDHNYATSLVEGVCKNTPNSNYADCVSALDLDPRTHSTSDLKTLARITLEIAIANVTNSKDYVDKLAKSKRTAPSLIPVLKNCSWGYWYAAASFSSAKTELDGDMMLANYDSLVARDGAKFCDTWLNSTRFDLPFIRARNYHVRLYSDIGFFITDQLDG